MRFNYDYINSMTSLLIHFLLDDLINRFRTILNPWPPYSQLTALVGRRYPNTLSRDLVKSSSDLLLNRRVSIAVFSGKDRGPSFDPRFFVRRGFMISAMYNHD